MSKRFSDEEKKMWLEDWKASGLSSYSYAKKNGLCQQSLRDWIKAETKKAFVEIKPAIKKMPSEIKRAIKIEKNGFTIHLPYDTDSSYLETVFIALGLCHAV
jgi:transposase-like protein